MLILPQDAAETVASADGQPGEAVRVGDRFGQRLHLPGVGDALVGTVFVVERLEFAERVQEMPLVPDQGAVLLLAVGGHRCDLKPAVRECRVGQAVPEGKERVDALALVPAMADLEALGVVDLADLCAARRTGGRAVAEDPRVAFRADRRGPVRLSWATRLTDCVRRRRLGGWRGRRPSWGGQTP
jgi:hypothetical protein